MSQLRSANKRRVGGLLPTSFSPQLRTACFCTQDNGA